MDYFRHFSGYFDVAFILLAFLIRTYVFFLLYFYLFRDFLENIRLFLG